MFLVGLVISADSFYSGYAQNMWYNVSKKDAEIAARETQKRIGAKYTLSIMCPPSTSALLLLLWMRRH